MVQALQGRHPWVALAICCDSSCWLLSTGQHDVSQFSPLPTATHPPLTFVANRLHVLSVSLQPASRTHCHRSSCRCLYSYNRQLAAHLVAAPLSFIPSELWLLRKPASGSAMVSELDIHPFPGYAQRHHDQQLRLTPRTACVSSTGLRFQDEAMGSLVRRSWGHIRRQHSTKQSSC